MQLTRSMNDDKLLYILEFGSCQLILTTIYELHYKTKDLSKDLKVYITSCTKGCFLSFLSVRQLLCVVYLPFCFPRICSRIDHKVLYGLHIST